MCEPEGTGSFPLGGAVKVAALVAAGLAVAGVVRAAAAAVVPVVAFTILGACVLGSVVVGRLIWAGRVRPAAAAVQAPPVTARAALPAAPRALPAGQLPGKWVTLTRADYEEVPR